MIARATLLEWPQIQKLRALYYERFPPLPWEVPSNDAAVWWCVRMGETVIGACAWEDGTGGVRWVTGFYVADIGRVQRVKVAIMMRDKIVELARADRRPLATMCRTGNAAQMRFLFRRSQARPLSVVLFQPSEGDEWAIS